MLAAFVLGLMPSSVGAAGGISMSGLPSALVEGTTYTGVLAHLTYDCGTDPCPAASAFSAFVRFGHVTVSAAGGGSYVVNGTISPSDDSAGMFISVRGPNDAWGAAALRAAEAPITVSIESVDITPNSVTPRIFSYADPGMTVLHPAIDWGDGTRQECGSGHGTLTPHVITLSCDHVYHKPGTYQVRGSVVDDATTFAGAGTVVVEPLALKARAPRRMRVHRKISLTVAPTLAASVRAVGTLLFPAGAMAS
jgi:hypothetical protein